MTEREQAWGLATKQAASFLKRFHDPWTRSHREDLVQESAIAAWRWSARPHDPQRFWAAVRTIAGRVRGRQRAIEGKRESAQDEVARNAAQHSEEVGEGVSLAIAGGRVSVSVARTFLDAALARLTELDRSLLLAFHEGFCCAELSHRFDLTEPCVKTRLHRARRRLKKDIEALAGEARDLDVS